jgi:hypothetical protein
MRFIGLLKAKYISPNAAAPDANDNRPNINFAKKLDANLVERLKIEATTKSTITLFVNMFLPTFLKALRCPNIP